MFHKIFFILLISLIFSAAISCSHGNASGNYGEIVNFKKDEPVSFPDFKLTYTGERKQTSRFPNGNFFTFTYYDFTIKNETEEKTVSWSAGTGEIGPVKFEFKGKMFALALMYWDKEKKYLGDEELVISIQ